MAALVDLLGEVRAWLARPDNDFSWSSFLDADAALVELDGLTTLVRAEGRVPFALSVLFAPTGPIQEVALSSGWGDEFLTLAARFDAAAGEDSPAWVARCRRPPYSAVSAEPPPRSPAPPS
ncbi:hypothetical protein [Catellatospora citrea]|uniref:hypothetical protein n=1 Tax=Catellatospora citrea TaxID=53366 RepID=UPI0011C41C08|nr:hypothetical protein [Catellatospora citrea]